MDCGVRVLVNGDFFFFFFLIDHFIFWIDILLIPPKMLIPPIQKDAKAFWRFFGAKEVNGSCTCDKDKETLGPGKIDFCISASSQGLCAIHWSMAGEFEKKLRHLQPILMCQSDFMFFE